MAVEPTPFYPSFLVALQAAEALIERIRSHWSHAIVRRDAQLWRLQKRPAPDCPEHGAPCISNRSEKSFTRYYCRHKGCRFSKKIARPPALPDLRPRCPDHNVLCKCNHSERRVSYYYCPRTGCRFAAKVVRDCPREPKVAIGPFAVEALLGFVLRSSAAVEAVGAFQPRGEYSFEDCNAWATIKGFVAHCAEQFPEEEVSVPIFPDDDGPITFSPGRAIRLCYDGGGFAGMIAFDGPRIAAAALAIAHFRNSVSTRAPDARAPRASAELTALDAYAPAMPLCKRYGFPSYKKLTAFIEKNRVSNHTKGNRRFVHVAELERAVTNRESEEEAAKERAAKAILESQQRRDAVSRSKRAGT